MPLSEISTKIAPSQVLVFLLKEYADSYLVCELFGFLVLSSYLDWDLWSLSYVTAHQVWSIQEAEIQANTSLLTDCLG